MIDLGRIRDEARKRIQSGAVTAAYSGDLQTIGALLSASLSNELVCWLRYTQNACVATGIRAEVVAAEFREHATVELAHAAKLATRIVQLGGEPDLSPRSLLGAQAQYVAGTDLHKMIVDNLVEERVAIDWYRAAISRVGADDPTTRRLFEEILADEEEHADDLASFLRGHPADA